VTDYFSSDHHFFHDNIRKYAGRDFKNVKEMNKALIEKHNEVVKPEDTTYFLGDFAIVGRNDRERLRATVGKLNGTKHLILGNHDECRPFDYVDIGFTSVHTSLIYNDSVVLIHDPAAAGVIMQDKLWLVGHVHTLFHYINAPVKCFNVGVDVNNFYPVTLNQVTTLTKSYREQCIVCQSKTLTYF